ncbi:hypothetical protein P22_1611 [Propionispora sp. 2/2-37]|uniref:PTS glucitol/sorbitol transporter subunit IIA n=1 Tax=Propionispora sp. 2/2-37 TaxID=1677858 RepID=UPI0006BB8D22|nr:PTS glucitol/sorbitol transporter subunit IIA [Propionispora sp. 2/2-37]CUH95540.1 hypothetical protein P22_1611 [Propionispora sp. 2/2-37]
MKFHCEITGWGPEAVQFLTEPDLNSIIIFNEGVPPELAEMAVLHKPAPLLAEPVVGDTLSICGKVFTISAVGSEVVNTLKELGHCTLNFKGGPEPERPGCIMLEGDELTPEDIVAGATIEIF